MVGNVETLHENMDGIQKNVYKLKTPKLKRMFQRGPKSRQGMRSVGSSREVATERDKQLANGVALDLDADIGQMGAKAPHPDSNWKRNALLSGHGGRRGADEEVLIDGTQISEDYSHHSDAVQRLLMEQDEDLDVIAGVAKDIMELSKAMRTS